ncbi:hypothetical protein [Robertkochia aurantiaca]|uniref:hypothetical protein n=1 Tax=Robertkochia aurantiaca TaxID=2873700 RepID=UPI001CCCF822|nr:hypothetical protein [Robertkochia sp. 3YJGBD-33]
MKTLMTAVIAFLLTGAIYAQETAVELEDVTVSAINDQFLRLVNDDYTPEVAKEVQLQAAMYDLFRNAQYRISARPLTFAEFTCSNGSMYTNFNHDGKIVSCRERYKDVVLPLSIREMVFEDHDGWSLEKNQYQSFFKNDELIKREYQVSLVRGKEKKTMTIDLKNEQ